MSNSGLNKESLLTRFIPTYLRNKISREKPTIKLSQLDLHPLIESRLLTAISNSPNHPKAIIVVGPIASGKTTLRKTKFRTGYVHIDSADIFHEFSNGNSTLDFPTAFVHEIDFIGRELTKESFNRKLSILLEIPGHEEGQLTNLIKALASIGYKSEILTLSTDQDTCERQHAERGDNVSSYWAAPIHIEWILSECARRAAA